MAVTEAVWNGLDFDRTVRDFDFTRRAVNRLNSVVYSAEFEEMDSEAIFDYLFRDMELVSFKDFLKRYIYERAGLSEPFREVEDDVYIDIIVNSFQETGTPRSFGPTSKKWRAVAKGFISQDSVKRQTVFLLGFGLSMTAEDVSEFLTKVIKESDFDLADPVETTYLYCYRNHLRYADALSLLEQAEAMAQGAENDSALKGSGKTSAVHGTTDAAASKGSGKTSAVHGTTDNAVSKASGKAAAANPDIPAKSVAQFRIEDPEELKAYLAAVSRPAEGGKREDVARAEFDRLLEQARTIAAGLYQKDEEEAQELSGKRSRDGSAGGMKAWRAEDISNGDLERMICSGIPLTGNGNLQKMSASLLSKHFQQKRMSRQRLDEIAKGKSPVERFDLITMLFFIDSQTMTELEPEVRCRRYIDEINEILTRSRMMELYPVNPYESFILMCLLSEEPLATYSEIWEMSYEDS